MKEQQIDLNTELISKTNSLQSPAGFSLIELLTIVAFIGVLAAIALSSYGQYKLKALNTLAKTDLKFGLISEEAYYAENRQYLNCTSVPNCETSLPSFIGAKEGDGTPASSPFNFSTTGEDLSGTAKHHKGTITWTYNNTLSGSINES